MKNKAQVGDKGFDGRIFPVSALDNVRKAGANELALEERFFPRSQTPRGNALVSETLFPQAPRSKGEIADSRVPEWRIRPVSL
jgi:hypothetical protein